MKIKQWLKLSAIGAGMLVAPPLLAADQVGADAALPRQQERSAMREEMQNRLRAMTPEERQLMKDTTYQGRAAMADGGPGHGAMAHERMRDGSGSGSQYGRGFESRQGGSGMPGGGGRGGRGR